MRFVVLLVMSGRPLRFIALWLYIARREVRIALRLAVCSFIGFGVQAVAMASLMHFTDIKYSIIATSTYMLNYTIKYLLFKYKVFYDKSGFAQSFLQWCGYMIVARIVAWISDYFDQQHYTVVSNYAIMIPISLVIIYTFSRFLAFKRQ